jgi:hypothetical protein
MIAGLVFVGQIINVLRNKGISSVLLAVLIAVLIALIMIIIIESQTRFIEYAAQLLSNAISIKLP